MRLSSLTTDRPTVHREIAEQSGSDNQTGSRISDDKYKHAANAKFPGLAR